MAKKFLVSKAVRDKDLTGVHVDGKEYKFSEKAGYSFTVSDPGVADVISKELGTEGGSKKVIVSEIPNYKSREDMGHKYQFTIKKCDEKGCFRKPVARGYCEEHYGLHFR